MKNRDILKALKRGDPVRAMTPSAHPTPTDVRDAITARPVSPLRRSRDKQAPSAPHRKVAIGAAVALAAAVTLVGLPRPGGDSASRSEVSSGPAGDVLLSMSGVAAAQAAPGPTEAGALYTKSTVAYSSTTVLGGVSYSVLLPETSESWILPDGSGRLRVVHDSPEWRGPEDKERWKAAGEPSLPAPNVVTDRSVEAGGLNGKTGEQLLPATRDLPTDVDELRSLIFNRAKQSGQPLNVFAFTLASEVLMQPGTPSDLRSALYEVMASIEGVQLRSETKDPRGRTGTAVSIDDQVDEDVFRQTLIFDSASAKPLSLVDQAVNPPKSSDYTDGEVLGYTVLEEEVAVPDTQARP